MAVTAAMNMYTRKKMLGRKVAIAGKSDRRTAASTGFRNSVRRGTLIVYRVALGGCEGSLVDGRACGTHAITADQSFPDPVVAP